jgi:thioesterase domain-containing protein
VAPLILIDAYAPARLAELGGSGGKSTSEALAVFARDLMGIFGSERLRRDDGEIVNSIADLYRVPELEPALDGVDPTRLARRFAIFSANLRMAEAYRPEPCALAATLYVATDGHADRTRGWSSLMQGGLSIEDLPGDHYALLTEPLVEHLARSLARDIGRLPTGR